MSKRLCDDCGLVEGVKWWHTGALLCDSCWNEWSKKDDKMRKIDVKKEFIFGE